MQMFFRYAQAALIIMLFASLVATGCGTASKANVTKHVFFPSPRPRVSERFCGKETRMGATKLLS